MPYDLFLDDERDPPRDGRTWTVVRSLAAAVETVGMRGLPEHISFDHDLGEGGTGYDFAKWLVEHCLDTGLPPDFTYYVHSQNPIGAENIRSLIDGFQTRSGIGGYPPSAS